MDKNFILELLVYFKYKKYDFLIAKLSFLFLEFFNNNNEEYINEFIKLDENKECNSYDGRI